MALDIQTIDLEATVRDKILFAAMAIPVSGILGATLRVFGGISETVTLIIVLPLFCAAFVAWHVGIAVRRARRRAAGSEHEVGPRLGGSAQYVQQRMHARPD